MIRNIGLDLLKILGCFAVVVLHVAGRSGYLLNSTLYYASSFAVPMFFMVNGNLLLNRNSLEYKYVIKKILNILLLVFSWNILLCIVKLIWKHKFNNPLFLTAENFIQKNYFWQFWFFGSLLLIYFILPIIYKYFKDNKNSIFITVFFIIISLLIDFTSIFRSITGNSIIQIHIIQTFRLWTWLSYFLLGGLIGKNKIKDLLKKYINKYINMFMFIFMTIIVIIYQYNMAKYVYKIQYAEYFYDNIFTFVWLISLFLLLYRLDYLKLKNNIINTISNNIMGIYIIHVTIIKIFTHFYKFESSLENILLIILVFMASFIVSFFINRFPLINILTKI
ncbi:acyltransferase [Clostridium pasteurianum]|nr:acyltransferase family protein [Clostridium pasteurianum]